MNAVEKWNELVPHGNLGSWKFSMRLKCQTRDEEFERICATFSATARFLSQTKLLKIPAENLKKVQYFGSWRRGWSWKPEMNREIEILKVLNEMKVGKEYCARLDSESCKRSNHYQLLK